MTTKATILGLILCLLSCQPKQTDEDIWRLGWRMIENNWNQNIELANLQFDSLVNANTTISDKFLLEGLSIKHTLRQKEFVKQKLSQQSTDFLVKFCRKDFSSSYEICGHSQKEHIENTALQQHILKMYVRDQAIRGNIMSEIIDKYHIDTTNLKTSYDWSNPNEISLDKIHTDELKSIFEEYGFPSKQLVGRDAMQGIFIIIQHADGDKKWQKKQLPHIKKACDRGELDKGKYAYLYDRIQVNSDKPQRYGTQFKNVSREKGIAELEETEDIQHLDKRRMEMDMMPIQMYERLMLNVTVQ